MHEVLGKKDKYSIKLSARLFKDTDNVLLC